MESACSFPSLPMSPALGGWVLGGRKPTGDFHYPSLGHLQGGRNKSSLSSPSEITELELSVRGKGVQGAWYKLPIEKQREDLWRRTFCHRIDKELPSACLYWAWGGSSVFCSRSETLAHLFVHCPPLVPLRCWRVVWGARGGFPSVLFIFGRFRGRRLSIHCWTCLEQKVGHLADMKVWYPVVEHQGCGGLVKWWLKGLFKLNQTTAPHCLSTPDVINSSISVWCCVSSDMHRWLIARSVQKNAVPGTAKPKLKGQQDSQGKRAMDGQTDTFGSSELELVWK